MLGQNRSKYEIVDYDNDDDDGGGDNKKYLL